MSTKTITKRIALVAASALALGGFSVISAPQASAAGNATAIAVSTSVLVGPSETALTSANYTTAKVVHPNGISSFNATVNDTVTLGVIAVGGNFETTDTIKVVNRGFGNLYNSTAINATRDLANNIASGFTETVTITTPAVPGTYTLDVFFYSDGTSAAATDLSTTVTMVIAADSSYSNSFSTALMAAGGSTAPTATTDALAVSASKTASSDEAALIKVSIKDSANADMASGNAISATVTGPGYVTWLSTADDESGETSCAEAPQYSAVIGRSITAQTVDALGFFAVCADGTTGTSTITINITNAAGVTSLLSTKTVTFYGSVASLSVHKTNFTIGKAGGATTGSATGAGTSDTITYMPAFVVVQKDSLGTLATGSAPSVFVGTSTVVTSGACAQDNNATYGTGSVGYWGCSFTTSSAAKSGDKATLTIRMTDPADSTKYLTATVDVTVGGGVAKEVISFDKNSYSAGEAMVVTITATDSSGNPVWDGDNSPALTGSKAVGGSLPAAGYYVGGKKATAASALYAPAIGGDFIVSGTGTDAAATAISATVSVEGDESASLALDAANAATDAANNAYDEAQNATQAASDALAAVTALGKQVKSLIASVKKLTKAVAKLS